MERARVAGAIGQAELRGLGPPARGAAAAAGSSAPVARNRGGPAARGEVAVTAQTTSSAFTL